MGKSFAGGKVFLKIILTVIPFFLAFFAFKTADKNLMKQPLYSYDVAYFGGDVWEYQTMAVNWLKGHGVSYAGKAESFETYKFAPMGDPNTLAPKSFNAYRSPAQPLLLGVVYKIFGVHPLKAKQVQLSIIIAIAVILPFIGFHLWGLTGYVSSLIAGSVYVYYQHAFALILGTEPLIAFFTLLVSAAFILYEKKQNIPSALLLGFSIAGGLLIKPWFSLIIPLLMMLFAYRYFKKRESKILIHSGLIVAAFLIGMAPWSIYASKNTGKFVFVSTQGSVGLLDGNNEYSLTTEPDAPPGGWHYLWGGKKDAFYNRADIKDKSAMLKVLHFYWENPVVLLTIFPNKIKEGFWNSFSFWLLWGLFLIEAYTKTAEKFLTGLGKSKYFTVPSVLLLLGFLYSANLRETGIVWGFLALTVPILFLKKELTFFNAVPDIFKILIVNILLIVLITFGVDRFVTPINYVFTLCAAQYIFYFLGIYQAEKTVSA